MSNGGPNPIVDGVANPRHNLELLGALLVGEQVMQADQVQGLISLLATVGVPEEAISIVGLVAILAARVFSWMRRRPA